MTTSSHLPMGIKIIIGFHLLSFVLWIVGQTGAVVAYDWVASLGMQDSRARLDPAIVETNRGIGLADTVLMLPLHMIAAIGLIRARFYGAVASWLVFGLTLYWPLVYWCSQMFYAEAGIRHAPTSPATILIPGVLLLIAAWGTAYLTRRRNLLH